MPVLLSLSSCLGQVLDFLSSLVFIFIECSGKLNKSLEYTEHFVSIKLLLLLSVWGGILWT